MASWLSKLYHSYLICLSYVHGALCYLAFCTLRCATATLTLPSLGQLGRKLREWGIYKYESNTRSSDIGLPSHSSHVDEALRDNLPPAVPEDHQIYPAFFSNPLAAQSRLLQTVDIEYPESR